MADAYEWELKEAGDLEPYVVSGGNACSGLRTRRRKNTHYGRLEDSARYELSTTRPATLAGLMALATYVVGCWEGRYSSSGRSDPAFAEDDMLNVIIGASEFLQNHLDGNAHG